MTMFEDTPPDDAPKGKPENPAAPFSRLAGRVRDESKPIGLLMRQFVIIPNPDPAGPHRAHAVFVLDEDKDKGIGEKDEAFEKMLEETEKAEREHRAAEQRKGLEELRDQLKRPGDGIL